MSYQNLIKVDQLSNQNYDTWKVQMQSLLIKSDLWEYVSGELIKPTDVAKIAAWKKSDSKAKADIILAISPPLLKDVKDCTTSREIWLKLQETYDSKIPTRKAALFKKLLLARASSDEDIEKHVSDFFDVVNKLNSIDIKIDNDLLSIILLYTLPEQFENFRIAIEARDELPKPSALKIKIIEEYHARRSSSPKSSEALVTESKKMERKMRSYEKNIHNQGKGTNTRHKIMCYKCRKYECRTKLRNYEKTSFIQESSFAMIDNNVNNKWILDSGATSHMVNDLNAFIEFKEEKSEISLANERTAEIKGKGKVKALLEDGNKINLQNVLYIPSLRANLLSVSKITQNNRIIFSGNEAKVKDKNNNTILKAIKKNNLYEVNIQTVLDQAHYTTKEDKIILWHQRYGHISYKTLAEMINSKKIQGIDVQYAPSNYNPSCITCIQGKQRQKPFKKGKREKRSKPLDLIHSDICGPIRTTSGGGARYFITFIDDASRWCEIYFLKSKNEALEAFKEYKAKMENFKETHIKILRTDNGKEYVNKDFSDFLKNSGIHHQLTVEYTPQQNGVAERKNRTLIEMARCMLLQSELPTHLWAEAVATANYIRNRAQSNSIDGETPYKLWTGRTPQIAHLRIFGTLTYALRKGIPKRKFDAKSISYYLVGYSDQAKAYRLWNKETNKIIKSRDVIFVDEGKTVKNEIRILQENRPDYREILEIKEEHLKNNNINNDQEEKSDQESEENEILHKEDKNSKRRPGRPKLVRTGQRGRPRKLFIDTRDKETDNQTENETNGNIEYTNEDTDGINEGDTHAITNKDTNRDTERDSDINCNNERNDITDDNDPFYGFIANEKDPKNINDIFQNTNQKEWKDAVKEELAAHKKNNTWEIIEKPENAKVIGSRWIFTSKFDDKGKLIKRKARLVAKGCTQIPGVDFNETYSPVAKQKSIRIIAAIAAKLNLTLRQYDITTAYLNGELKETIYMKPPECLDEWDTRTPMHNKVCKLNKAIYGLKQSGRVWYQKLDQYLRKIGCENLETEPCIYFYKCNSFFTIMGIYVDDIIMASTNEAGEKWFNKQMSNEFDIKDLGKLKYFLGIEFERLQNGDIILHQRKYINKLLERFNMKDCNPVKTPMDPNTKLTKGSSPKTEQERWELAKIPYQNLIGSLLYLAVTSRPDVIYAVNSLSRYNNNFNKAHWIAAKRVLRYLKCTANYSLIYRKNGEDLKGFADADWGSDIDDRKSYTGYLFKMSSAPISWEAKKQPTVALSTAEAEYMALTEATKEAIHLRNLLFELGIRDTTPINIFNDNRSAQYMASNPTINSRSKHIDIKQHFIRDAVAKGKIRLNYLETNSMPADIFTKPLTAAKFKICLELLPLENYKIAVEGGA